MTGNDSGLSGIIQERISLAFHARARAGMQATVHGQ